MTISFRQWVSETVSCLRADGQNRSRCLLKAAYLVYVGMLLSIERIVPIGTNIFEKDWDALIVLDACRADALAEVSDEYDFITEVDVITSVGSMTPEWMSNTFRTDYLADIRQTAYVVKNGFMEIVLDERGHTGFDAIPFGPSTFDVVSSDDFGRLEALWKVHFDGSSRWMVGEGDASRLHPRYITDRAIDVGRNSDTEKLIVHYIYPHEPYPLANKRLRRPFDALSKGEASRDDVWEAYLDNLRFVLDDVAILLENLDAKKVVITADHGEAFGEYGFYQHLIGCPVPCVRRVPWVETSASDTGEYITEAPEPMSVSESKSVEERLEELGYM